MRKLLTLLALMAVPARAEVVREMTPERVREALAWGAGQKDHPSYRLKGPSPLKMKGYRVAVFGTPYARAAAVGFAAKQEYRTAEPAAVDAQLLEPYVNVYAPPHRTQGRPPRVIGVRKIVLTGPRGASPIQPTDERSELRSYGNALGAEWQANSVHATFPLDAVRPDTEVHVLYEDGEDVTYRFDLNGVR
jgi:hypothetical protein